MWYAGSQGGSHTSTRTVASGLEAHIAEGSVSDGSPQQVLERTDEISSSSTATALECERHIPCYLFMVSSSCSRAVTESQPSKFSIVKVVYRNARRMMDCCTLISLERLEVVDDEESTSSKSSRSLHSLQYYSLIQDGFEFGFPTERFVQ